jgi:hypothetical protein
MHSMTKIDRTIRLALRVTKMTCAVEGKDRDATAAEGGRDLETSLLVLMATVDSDFISLQQNTNTLKHLVPKIA